MARPEVLADMVEDQFSPMAVMLPSVMPLLKIIPAHRPPGTTQPAVRHDHQDGQPDRRRHDHDVAVIVEVDPAEHLEAHDGHGGEHGDGRATEHRVMLAATGPLPSGSAR